MKGNFFTFWQRHFCFSSTFMQEERNVLRLSYCLWLWDNTTLRSVKEDENTICILLKRSQIQSVFCWRGHKYNKGGGKTTLYSVQQKKRRNFVFFCNALAVESHVASFKHCQRHIGPKALSAFTQSTPFIQSSSFDKSWILCQISAWFKFCVNENVPRQITEENEHFLAIWTILD